MQKELIGSLLFLLIAAVLLPSGREISLTSKKTYLTAKASLIGNEGLDFKLSLNYNRLRLRRKTRFLPFLSGSSYNPGCFLLENAEFCANPCYNEEAFKNSLSFSQEMHISDLELIFTNDPTVSVWFDFNGILGLNPFEGCSDESDSLDPQAPLNQLRGDNSVFVLDFTRLTFSNEFPQIFHLPLDGMYFEMKEIAFGNYNFGGVSMKGKIDLESRYIKVPARHFDELWKEFGFLYEQEAWYEDKAKRYMTGKLFKNIQIAITSKVGRRTTLKLPLLRYELRAYEYFIRLLIKHFYSRTSL